MNWAKITNTCPLCKRRFSKLVGEDHQVYPVADCIQRVDNNTFVYIDEENQHWSSENEASEEDGDEDWTPHVDRDHLQVGGETPIEDAISRKRRRREMDTILEEITETFGNRYQCEKCGKQFRRQRKADYTRHLLTHEEGECIRKFACEKCGKRFKLKGDLKRHAQSHGERKFQCECGVNFTTKGNLDRHVHTLHMKERRFKCEECGSKFGQSGDLARHSVTHNPSSRKFSCSDCNMSFAQKQHLMTHLNSTIHKKSKVVQ